MLDVLVAVTNTLNRRSLINSEWRRATVTVEHRPVPMRTSQGPDLRSTLGAGGHGPVRRVTDPTRLRALAGPAKVDGQALVVTDMFNASPITRAMADAEILLSAPTNDPLYRVGVYQCARQYLRVRVHMTEVIRVSRTWPSVAFRSVRNA